MKDKSTNNHKIKAKEKSKLKVFQSINNLQ